MLPLWAVAAAWAVTWGIQAAIAYHEGDDEEEKNKTFSKGSTTVAKEGSTLNLVFGTCRVDKTNIFAYGSPRLRDEEGTPGGQLPLSQYIRLSRIKWELVGNSSIIYLASCHVGVCAVPQTPYIFVKFRGMWVGEKRIGSAIPDPSITYTDIPFQAPGPVFESNCWGGRGKGGGVGRATGLSRPSELEGVANDPLGDGTIRYSTGTPDSASTVASRNVIMGRTDNAANSTSYHGGMPGIAWFLLNQMMLGEGATMPSWSPEITVWPDFSTLAPQAIESRVNNESKADANPAAAIYQILTDEFTGLGLDPADIDAASFNVAGGILNTEGNGLSMVVSKAVTVKKLVEQILRQIDGVLYVDPDTLQLTLDLIRAADIGVWPYAGLDTYDDDHVSEVTSYKLTAWEDTYNQVRLKFEDRANEYNERYAVMQDTGGSNSTGRIRSKDVSFPGIKVASLANEICARELAFYATPQLSVVLKMNRETISMRPGSAFKWTCPAYSIENMVLRVIKIDFGTIDDGTVQVTCVRDKFSSIPATFQPPFNPRDSYAIDKVGLCNMVVQEVPPNPNFGEGGSNYDSAAIGGLMVMGTYGGGSSGGSAPSNGLELNVAILPTAGNYYYPPGQPADVSECAEVGVAYSMTPGSYYDVSFNGMNITGLSTTSVLKNSTQEEVSEGRAIILVGNEYMSYESYTDLSEVSYRSSAQAETAASQTSISIAMPAGTIEDDLLIVIINMGTAEFATAPAGWTHVAGSPNVNELGTSDCNMVVMTKVAGVAEAGPYAFTRDAADAMEIQGSIHTFLGGLEVDFVNFQQKYETQASGVTPDVYTGGGDSGESEFYMTAVGVSGQWYDGGSTIDPTSGWTELDDVTSDIDGQLQVQYRASIQRGDVQVDLNLSGPELISTHTLVTIGIRGLAVEDRSYKLTNVWRGLFDTVPEDHGLATSVIFLGDVDMGRVITQSSHGCTDGDVILQTSLNPVSQRSTGEVPVEYASITTTKRDQRPTHPTSFALIDRGADSKTSTPEIDYAYNDDSPTDVVNASVSGADATVSSAGVFGDVWTNDLRASWNRRPKITGCGASVIRGDQADSPYGDGEGTSLRVEGKGDLESTWTTLTKEDIQDNKITSNTEFVDMSKAVAGSGSVRVCAFTDAKTTGEELMSRSAESVTVDVHTSRQLLINQNFVPYWDVDSDSSVASGKGEVLPGNPVYSARGWRNVTAGSGRPRYKVLDGSILQGDDTEGFAFAGEFIEGEYVTIEQVVAVPYLDTEGSEVYLAWWFQTELGDETEWYNVTIDTLDVNGIVLDTTNIADNAGTAVDTWAKYDLTLTAMSAAVRSIRVTLGIRNTTAGGRPAICKASMVMGRDTVANQLLNPQFNTPLTSWTSVGGAFTAELAPARGGGINKVDVNFSRYAQSATTDGEIYQDVTVPAAYGTGDYVRLQWWTATTGASGYGYVILGTRNAGGQIGSITVGGDPHPIVDQWYYHEAYMKIPGECTTIRASINYKAGGGAGEDFLCDAMDMTFIKGGHS